MKKWQENLRKVTPYVAGEQPKDKKVIKLNTNENPYPPSPGVYAKSRTIDVASFSKYPDPDSTVLVKELAKYHDIDMDQIFVGVGSDDVLSLAFLTYFNSKKPILFPDVTYSFYPVWANVYQIPFETPALRDDFTVDVADYKKENGGIVIANPNAPTSISMGLDQVEDILRANQDVVVIIDEAYVDFGGNTALPLIDKYDNLLVVRTYSKSRSMAGMRIGYAMGNKDLIEAMKAVKESINSYTMNTESILLARESLKDEEYFRRTIAQIMATRQRVTDTLRSIGFTVLDSNTNFIFASHEKVPARYIFESLREKGIYVRFFDKKRIDNYLRISIGTDLDMDVLIRGIVDCIKEYK